MTQRHGFKTIIVYFIGGTKEECQQAFMTLLQLLTDLGFQISWHKVIGPTQKLVLLGVELHTASSEMAIPPIKLMELHQWLPDFFSRVEKVKSKSSSLVANSTGHVGWSNLSEMDL